MKAHELDVCILLPQISCQLKRDLQEIVHVNVYTNPSGRVGFLMFAVILNVLFKTV